MRLAICATGEGLSASVDQRFGRCAFFVIVDPEKGELLESIPNDSASASGGAGPQAVQLLTRYRVDAVVLGNAGPNAAAALKAAKIKSYGGLLGTVESTAQLFNNGQLTEVTEATVQSHSGMR